MSECFNHNPKLYTNMCYDDYYEVDDATWDYVESWFEGASA